MTPWQADALRHLLGDELRERCGLLVVVRGRLRYWPAENIATDPDEHFILDPATWAAAEDAGEVVGVVHSHPGATAAPSEADMAGCEASGVPWHILGLAPEAHWSAIEPSGWRAQLVGREFVYGLMDCYTLIRDWYAQERGVTLPDFPRSLAAFQRGESLYEQGFPRAGFRRVSGDPLPGDVLLFQVGAPVPDHGAVYLGDDRMLHHMQGRLSSRDSYGGFWRERLRAVLRYEGNPALR